MKRSITVMVLAYFALVAVLNPPAHFWWFFKTTVSVLALLAVCAVLAGVLVVFLACWINARVRKCFPRMEVE
jgi:hypothetical protein